jgi:hypothetical protein
MADSPETSSFLKDIAIICAIFLTVKKGKPAKNSFIIQGNFINKQVINNL